MSGRTPVIAAMLLISVLGGHLIQSAVAPIGEHDIGGRNAFLAEARAQEPAVPTEEPTPPGEHSVTTDTVPTLKFIPENAPPGTPVQLIFNPPTSERVALKWGEAKFGKVPAGENVWHVWPALGENTASVEVLWTTADSIESRDLVARHFSGAPPPPKPLAELAGPHAKKLGTWYLLQVDVAPALESVSRWHALHAAKLATLVPPVPDFEKEVATKFVDISTADGALDRVKLVKALDKVVTELGTEPDPDKPPIDPVDPNATPISFDGFHVVFIEEGSTRPVWLNDLLLDPAVEGYLNSHCLGGQKGWRRWDQNAVLTNAPANLRTLAELPRPSVPAVHIAWNKQAVVLPLGKQTPTELLATLKKYGGP